jgi:cell wall-associated NlpC family hydrolase
LRPTLAFNKAQRLPILAITIRHAPRALWRKGLLASVIMATLSLQPAWAQEEQKQESASALNSLGNLSSLSSFTDRAANLAIEAMSLIGIHYRRGGTTPENGLDCSGLVRYVFRTNRGADLPRTSAEMSKLGEHVDQKDLQPGDLVFFHTLRHAFSHVGIYLGDNKFIHAPSAGGKVRIESMDLSYWKNRFNGARRIADNTETENNR